MPPSTVQLFLGFVAFAASGCGTQALRDTHTIPVDNLRAAETQLETEDEAHVVDVYGEELQLLSEQPITAALPLLGERLELPEAVRTVRDFVRACDLTVGEPCALLPARAIEVATLRPEFSENGAANTLITTVVLTTLVIGVDVLAATCAAGGMDCRQDGWRAAAGATAIFLSLGVPLLLLFVECAHHRCFC